MSRYVGARASLPPATVGTDGRDAPQRLTDQSMRNSVRNSLMSHGNPTLRSSPHPALSGRFLLPSQEPPGHTASCADCSCLRPLSGVLPGQGPISVTTHSSSNKGQLCPELLEPPPSPSRQRPPLHQSFSNMTLRTEGGQAPQPQQAGCSTCCSPTLQKK